MPKLSIIVPVYKTEKYLPKCIDSILSQTFTDFELILIDDGSPDRCGEICDEYAAKDDRIIVIHQENRGVSSARNAGLDIARGEYIGFVDSDDWIEPEMYNVMVRAAIDNITDVVLCGFQYFDGKKDIFNYGTEIPIAGMISLGQLMERTLSTNQKFYYGAVWNKLFRSECISRIRFDIDLLLIEDWLFVLSVYQADVRTAYVINEAFYHYTAEQNEGLSKTADPKRVKDSLLSFKRRIPTFNKQKLATIRFLDDAASFLPRIKKGTSAFTSRLSIKLCAMCLLVKGRLTGLISQTEFNKYSYEVLLIS